MIKKEFLVNKPYIHIPVKSGVPEKSYYVEVVVNEEVKNEFLIGIAYPDEKFDYYVAMDVNRYKSDKVTLICHDEMARENLFDGFIQGRSVFDEPLLYPNLYKEEIRQQVHFSPAIGWMNDPNGLFYKNGKFNMYFQHNPLANRHFTTNISWGHAITEDGLYFKEYPDAIMPRNSRVHIASGSAIVDETNISGFGKDTIIAAYTDLVSRQFHNRPAVTSGFGQNVMYSIDNGITFNYFPGNPVINVPSTERWRDPKILRIDENALCIAVYETYNGIDCISFYKSTDCKRWEFCSRILNYFECPDLFPLKVENSDEILWVLYGARGKYQIGRFENFEFKPLTGGEFIDYGDAVYAGQTFNNYGNEEKRIYVAWLRERFCGGEDDDNEPTLKFGFSQSMALFTEFSIYKTNGTYRLKRKLFSPIEKLRKTENHIKLNGTNTLPTPTETVFSLKGDKNITLSFGEQKVIFNAAENKIYIKSPKGDKEYQFFEKSDMKVCVIADTRSVEIYIKDEMVISFFTVEKNLTVDCDYEIIATQYKLKSIWE